MFTHSPTQPLRLEVRAGSRPSTILIGEGLGTRLQDVLDEAGLGRRRFVVSSPVVWKLHGPTIEKALTPTQVVLIPDGERFKTLIGLGFLVIVFWSPDGVLGLWDKWKAARERSADPLRSGGR